MKIIAHRGFWNSPEEKNSLLSFKRAFLNGYGVETDLRDYCGKLVISHNIADEKSILCDEFFDLYRQYGNDAPLALNIKADGIQCLLKNLLEKYRIQNYFVFDMSIPEQVVYKQEGIIFFTRCSDIEKECVLYKDALGIWLDTFYDDRWDILDSARAGLDGGKQVAIVSPELHGKTEEKMWNAIRKEGLDKKEGFYLCTDYPAKAMKIFGKE